MRQTSSGKGSAISAKERIPASYACGLEGNVRMEGDGDSESGLALTKISDKDCAIYRYIRFDGENTFYIYTKADKKHRVEIYIDGIYHAELIVNESDKYIKSETKMPPLVGTFTATIYFYCVETEGVFAFESFGFGKTE